MTADRPLSVAHVLWSGRVGGIERLVHQLALRQRDSGLTVSVVCGQARGPFAAAMRGSGLPVRDLRLRSGYDLRPWRIRAAARELAGSDVIHLHAFNLPIGAIAIASRRPLVFTEHGSRPGRKIKLTGRLRRSAQGSFLRRACDEIAANSSWTAARAAELYGLDPARMSVVHNGIPGRLPDTVAQPRRDDRMVVSFVGRLAAFKRVDRLLRALAQTRQPERLRVLIVGEGPLEADLKALAADLGCDAIVDFLGYRSDVDAILSATDVLVQPSEGEPFGLAIIEACRQGALPIAFADGGGALEVLPPDGRMVENESDLTRVLDEVVDNRALQDPTARRSRAEWAVERFPIRRTADAYLALYRSALEDSVA